MPVWKPIETIPRGKTVLIRKRAPGLENLIAESRPQDGWYYNTANYAVAPDEQIRKWADEWTAIPGDEAPEQEINQMSQNHDNDDVKLPLWIEGFARGDYLIIGAVLTRKDGRQNENATTVSVSWRSPAIATVMTDGGALFRLTESELRDRFLPPTWIRKMPPSHPATTVEESFVHSHGSLPIFESGTEKLVGNGDDHGQAILSIAASLKRIADIVDPVDKSRGTFFEQLYGTLENLIFNWMPGATKRR